MFEVMREVKYFLNEDEPLVKKIRETQEEWKKFIEKNNINDNHLTITMTDSYLNFFCVGDDFEEEAILSQYEMQDEEEE